MLHVIEYLDSCCGLGCLPEALQMGLLNHSIYAYSFNPSMEVEGREGNLSSAWFGPPFPLDSNP